MAAAAAAEPARRLKRRPPLARARGLSAADLSPLPPSRRFLCRPTAFLPTIPRAGRARAALEPPRCRPPLPPPLRLPPPRALPLQPGKTLERLRLRERPTPGGGGGGGGSWGVPVAAAVVVVTAGWGRGPSAFERAAGREAARGAGEAHWEAG